MILPPLVFPGQTLRQHLCRSWPNVMWHLSRWDKCRWYWCWWHSLARPGKSRMDVDTLNEFSFEQRCSYWREVFEMNGKRLSFFFFCWPMFVTPKIKRPRKLNWKKTRDLIGENQVFICRIWIVDIAQDFLGTVTSSVEWSSLKIFKMTTQVEQ